MCDETKLSSKGKKIKNLVIDGIVARTPAQA